MKQEFRIGRRTECVEIPEANFIGRIEANPTSFGLIGEAAVKAALDKPIGAPDLRMVVHPGEKIAIVGDNGTGKSTLLHHSALSQF